MKNRPKLRELAYMLGVYSQKTIPQTYINELSNYELLLTILSKINEIIERCGKYDEIINEIINYLDTLDEQVIDYLNELKDSGYIAEQIGIATERRFLIIGDSYTAGTGLVNPSADAFPALLRAKGYDVTDISSAGGGFLSIGVNGTFKDLCDNYSGDDTASYTDVFILGGINDVTSYPDQIATQLPNAIITCVNAVHTKFVNAKVHLGYISQRNYTPSYPYQIMKAIEVWKKSCFACNASYIDNAETMLKQRSLLQADGVHPTENGHQVIAGYLISYIINGNVSTGTTVQAPAIDMSNTPFSDVSGMFISSSQNDGIMNLFMPIQWIGHGNANYNFTFNGFFENAIYLGRPADFGIFGMSETSVYNGANNTNPVSLAGCTIPVVIGLADAFDADAPFETFNVNGNLFFNNGGMFLSIVMLDDTSAFKQGYLKQLNIPPFSAVIDAIGC